MTNAYEDRPDIWKLKNIDGSQKLDFWSNWTEKTYSLYVCAKKFMTDIKADRKYFEAVQSSSDAGTGGLGGPGPPPKYLPDQLTLLQARRGGQIIPTYC